MCLFALSFRVHVVFLLEKMVNDLFNDYLTTVIDFYIAYSNTVNDRISAPAQLAAPARISAPPLNYFCPISAPARIPGPARISAPPFRIEGGAYFITK